MTVTRDPRKPGRPEVWRFRSDDGRDLGTWVKTTGWWFMPGSRGQSVDERHVRALFEAHAATGLGWVAGRGWFPGPPGLSGWDRKPG